MFNVQSVTTKRNSWKNYPQYLFAFFLDAATPWQMNFQSPATEIMEKIVDLHHDIMFFLILIVFFVSWVLVRTIIFFASTNKNTLRVAFAHHTLLEKVWTYIPTFVLILIASPSFSLLYSIDSLSEPKISIKVIGHQWFWSYETTDLLSEKEVNFDSYMLAEDDLLPGRLRLLEVDNRLFVPVRTNIRVIITAADVLHSWAIPAFGVKMDACPGRLNQVSLYVDRAGTFYGQCSELCGINHSFMPIVVQAVTPDSYKSWLQTTAFTFILFVLFNLIFMPQVDKFTFYTIVFWTFCIYTAGYLFISTVAFYGFLTKLKIIANRFDFYSLTATLLVVSLSGLAFFSVALL